MGTFKDPARLARVAIVALWIYMVSHAAFGILAFVEHANGSDLSAGLRPSQCVALPTVFALLACFVLVGWWIYRTNANAHLFSEEMTISPGWAVGWYFIPFANWVKPFHGMKEAWMATHYSGYWRDEPAPSLLGWWWGLWVATNIMGNISFQVGRMGGPADLVVYLDLAASLLNVPLCLILIRLMRRLSRTQLLVHSAEAFT
jgi:hypothetical protein